MSDNDRSDNDLPLTEQRISGVIINDTNAKVSSTGFKKFVTEYVFSLRAYILALAAGAATIYAWFDSITTKIMPLYDRYTYLQTLQNPFPSIIDQGIVDGMSSGEAELALMRIDGYLGRLRDDRTWKKLCVTEAAKRSSKTPEAFLNTKYLLNESRIDQLNEAALQKRIDTIDIEKTEDAGIQRNPDIFERLLARSSKQLLYRYQSQELDLLDKPQLYLLRNSIYGRHGYIFSTAKLHKFTNRHGWKSLKERPDLPDDVEKCNASFLEELHPARELGAIGRGILFSQDDSIPATFKAEVCACLGRANYGIECTDGDGSSPAKQFYDYVDLVLEVRKGSSTEIKWSYLDPRAIGDTSRAQFGGSAARFHAAAVQFSAELQEGLVSAGEPLVLDPKESLEAYWGAAINLSEKFITKMASDAKTAFDMGGLVCKAIYNAIDQTGSIIPWTIGTDPETVDGSLLIFSKPVIFDDERLVLTRQYLSRAYPLSTANVELRPRAIVLQATESDDIDAVFQKMLPAGDPTSAKELNPTTHYLVGMHGTVYRLMNDTIIARHAPGLEMSAIGIGIVGAVRGLPQPEQIEAVRKLIKHLKAVYPQINVVVSQNEVSRYNKTDLWSGPPTPLDNPKLAPGEATSKAILLGLEQIGLRVSP
jgi:N-acetylmuramoyl-L-alanine amidase/YARHG domain